MLVVCSEGKHWHTTASRPQKRGELEAGQSTPLKADAGGLNR